MHNHYSLGLILYGNHLLYSPLAGGTLLKKIFKIFAFLSITGVIAFSFFSVYLGQLLPDTFLVSQGSELKIAGMPFLQVSDEHDGVSAAAAQRDNGQTVKLSIGGIIPVKTVRTQFVSRRVVTVCGTPFGIKMFANGAMVVGFSDIYTATGYQNPAKTAGLKMGDVVVSIAGKKTKTNEDVAAALQNVKGAPAEVVYKRDGKEKSVLITAVLDSATGTYRTGMWVRDSTAGIGTLTFANNIDGVFAGLGHSIHDVDTGKTVLLRKGEIVPVEITGAIIGTQGSPGELKGRFLSTLATGDIVFNTETGVYGKAYGYFKGLDVEVALPQEIMPGAVQIYTTINGETPKMYSAEIEKISMTSDDPNRNMVIHITDPRLLAATGGIVQGMSGSPILQNGVLIGAITHVLVNDPARGYAIFAQSMLDTADKVINTEPLDKAG